MSSEQAPKLLRVRNYEKHFESSRTVDIEQQTWRRKPIGKNATKKERILRERDGIWLWGAYDLLLDYLAALGRPRMGYLTHDGTASGDPLTMKDMITLLHTNRKNVERFLNFYTQKDIGYIEEVGNGCHGVATALPRHGNDVATTLPLERTREKRGEERRGEERGGEGQKRTAPGFAETIYRDVTKKTPTRDQASLIEEKVGALGESLFRWQRTAHAWTRLHNPENVAGMLEWFERGIPANKEPRVEDWPRVHPIVADLREKEREEARRAWEREREEMQSAECRLQSGDPASPEGFAVTGGVVDVAEG